MSDSADVSETPAKADKTMAETVLEALADDFLLGSYKSGLKAAIQEDSWRRASKHGPNNTILYYSDGSCLWWSPSRGSWLAGT